MVRQPTQDPGVSVKHEVLPGELWATAANHMRSYEDRRLLDAVLTASHNRRNPGIQTVSFLDDVAGEGWRVSLAPQLPAGARRPQRWADVQWVAPIIHDAMESLKYWEPETPEAARAVAQWSTRTARAANTSRKSLRTTILETPWVTSTELVEILSEWCKWCNFDIYWGNLVWNALEMRSEQRHEIAELLIKHVKIADVNINLLVEYVVTIDGIDQMQWVQNRLRLTPADFTHQSTSVVLNAGVDSDADRLAKAIWVVRTFNIVDTADAFPRHYNALTCACERGDTNVLVWLYERFNRTPTHLREARTLHAACAAGKLCLAQRLMFQYGMTAAGDKEYFAAAIACAEESKNAVLAWWLKTRAGGVTHSPDMLVAAVDGGSIATLRIIASICGDAAVNARSRNGEPLKTAARLGNLAMLQWLVARGRFDRTADRPLILEAHGEACASGKRHVAIWLTAHFGLTASD